MEAIQVTPVQETAQPESQPTPQLDDSAVREAIAKAEAQGQNPERLTIADLSQGKEAPPAPEAPAPVVPEKFVAPDGVVDVEKLKASTRQLDEAIQKKETEVQKSVDDYVREYREKEAKFRNLPNPQKLAEGLKAAPPPVVTDVTPSLDLNQLKARIAADYSVDPIGTMSELIDLMVKAKLDQSIKPIEEDIQMTRREREDNRIRQNLKEIAGKDARVLSPEVFAAINAKLESEPNLWNLKNPHKAAWLEVKEEMRLGEPSPAQAQPRPPSPILGGGTPPPTPSSSAHLDPRDPLGSLSKFDLRDKKQEQAADELIRNLIAQNERR